MARYVGPVCKLCRREGMKLYLKGERCYSGEVRRHTRARTRPGQHGQGRIKLSEYAVRLREKQKVRRIYGVLERQFAWLLPGGEPRARAAPGEEMLALLERRLDNVVYRIGFAGSRAEARQLVRHGHVKVNGKRLDIPSYVVRSRRQDRAHRERAKKFKFVGAAIAGADKRPIASWLEVDRANFTATSSPRPCARSSTSPSPRSASSSSSSTTRAARSWARRPVRAKSEAECRPLAPLAPLHLVRGDPKGGDAAINLQNTATRSRDRVMAARDRVRKSDGT
jgi:small subunit ribosomal protein S4